MRGEADRGEVDALIPRQVALVGKAGEATETEDRIAKPLGNCGLPNFIGHVEPDGVDLITGFANFTGGAQSMTYRRKRESDTWHFCTNCPQWPTSDYVEVESDTRPSSGELCDKCKAREDDGICQK